MGFSNAAVILQVALLLGALWLIVSRWRSRIDMNWPLVFYLALVAWHLAHPSKLNEYVVYVAVVLALFLRFEFMNERVAVVMKVLECGCLLVLAWRFAVMLAEGM